MTGRDHRSLGDTGRDDGLLGQSAPGDLARPSRPPPRRWRQCGWRRTWSPRQLERHRVDGDDVAGTGHGRALDRVDADAADADDDHGLARLHVGQVDRRAPAGGDPAADQGGLVEGDVVVQLDAGRLVHHGVRRECAETAHDAEVGAVGGVMAGGHVTDLASEDQKSAEVTQVRSARGAGRAAAARRHEAERHMVARLDAGHARTDLDDLAGALVPADDRQRAQPGHLGDLRRERDVAGDEVLVRVAQPGRGELDHHLALLGWIEDDVLHAPRGIGFPQNRGLGLHSSSSFSSRKMARYRRVW